MFREEKRKQERYSFELPPEGTVFLVRQGVRLPVTGIKDISNSGVSLSMDEAVEVFAPVTVEYDDTRACVQVCGFVTRCAPAGEADGADAGAGRFIIGIELASPLLLLSMFQKY
jgi:hypothetical protein